MSNTKKAGISPEDKKVGVPLKFEQINLPERDL